MTAPAVLDPSALDQILEDTGGDPEFIIELIRDYRDNTRTLLADLADACASGDQARARRAAHTMKGTSASMGALALSALAADAEAQCQAGNVQEVERGLPDLQDAFQLVELKLEQLLSRDWAES
jgi:HPt (histidine-containing phosphotransfer) domain-containing protein